MIHQAASSVTNKPRKPRAIQAVIADTFYAQWDVDGRWYMWIIFKLKNGDLIVNRYLA